MNPNIVILAGGVSSRMKKLIPAAEAVDPNMISDARKKSKSMIGLGENSRPFLDYLLFNVQKAGYTEVVIVVGEKDGSIRQYYETAGHARIFSGMKITYATQRIPEGRTKPLGTADALLEALRERSQWKGQMFTVCNSDNLYSVKALELLLRTPHKGAMIDYDRAALKFGGERISQFAVLQKDARGFLVNIIEKPTPEQIILVKDNTGRIGISMNIFRFNRELVLPHLEEVPMHPIRQEKELPSAVARMVASDPASVFTIPLSEYVPDLTSPGDIAEVRSYLRDHFGPF